MRRRPVCPPVLVSEFAGFRFPPEVIVLAVRWYLRYVLSYQDVEELLAERGLVEVTTDQLSSADGTPSANSDTEGDRRASCQVRWGRTRSLLRGADCLRWQVDRDNYIDAYGHLLLVGGDLIAQAIDTALRGEEIHPASAMRLIQGGKGEEEPCSEPATGRQAVS
ncbi:hypothetical protein FDG2_3878 [Candidatus Protofrankia californiensis]|uniref:Transposase n=1 Tax=Candidatus Protofrankia californiensis TaxID=1839754 RepID=A0A1C3P1H2_9ACTN|nr:hypothetical protein FDG2_3878 [Candidatus Protofrankia californiensis]